MILREYVRKRSEGGTPGMEIVLTPEEQRLWFAGNCEMIMKNTRWVLDNLESMPTYKVNWENYHRKNYHRDYFRNKKAKGL